MTTPVEETVPLDRLGAVNFMLASIGVNAVMSLDAENSNPDSERAARALTDAVRELNMGGHHFNTEKNYVIDPSETGEIVLPANTLQADTVGVSKGLDLVQRGLKLYSRTDHTFNIGKAVYVDLVLAHSFEDLPQPHRWYVVVKATRRFATNSQNTAESYRFTKEDEIDARNAFLHADEQTDDRTMAQANPHVARMRRR